METYIILLIFATFGLIAYLLSKRKDDDRGLALRGDDFYNKESEIKVKGYTHGNIDEDADEKKVWIGGGEGDLDFGIDDDGDDDDDYNLFEDLDFEGPGVEPLGLSNTFEGVKCNGGVGLCTVTKGTGRNSGIFAERVNDKSFMIRIKRKNISQKDEMKILGIPIPKQLGNTNFPVEKDTLVDQSVAEHLRLNPNYLKIATGSYPMAYDNKLIMIVIDLTN